MESQTTQSENVAATTRELTYGEKAVGLTFNPSNNSEVQSIKEIYASVIDHCNKMRALTDNTEQKRLFSIAITEAQTAQMWAVKAVTWNF